MGGDTYIESYALEQRGVYANAPVDFTFTLAYPSRRHCIHWMVAPPSPIMAMRRPHERARGNSTICTSTESDGVHIWGERGRAVASRACCGHPRLHSDALPTTELSVVSPPKLPATVGRRYVLSFLPYSVTAYL